MDNQQIEEYVLVVRLVEFIGYCSNMSYTHIIIKNSEHYLLLQEVRLCNFGIFNNGDYRREKTMELNFVIESKRYIFKIDPTNLDAAFPNNPIGLLAKDIFNNLVLNIKRIASEVQKNEI